MVTKQNDPAAAAYFCVSSVTIHSYWSKHRSQGWSTSSKMLNFGQFDFGQPKTKFVEVEIGRSRKKKGGQSRNSPKSTTTLSFRSHDFVHYVCVAGPDNPSPHFSSTQSWYWPIVLCELAACPCWRGSTGTLGWEFESSFLSESLGMCFCRSLGFFISAKVFFPFCFCGVSFLCLERSLTRLCGSTVADTSSAPWVAKGWICCSPGRGATGWAAGRHLEVHVEVFAKAVWTFVVFWSDLVVRPRLMVMRDSRLRDPHPVQKLAPG